MNRSIILKIILAVLALPSLAEKEYSGIYPHLAVFNDGTECGIGTVVPWADRLWITTYSAHVLDGKTDRLFEISSDLKIFKNDLNWVEVHQRAASYIRKATSYSLVPMQST